MQTPEQMARAVRALQLVRGGMSSATKISHAMELPVDKVRRVLCWLEGVGAIRDANESKPGARGHKSKKEKCFVFLSGKPMKAYMKEPRPSIPGNKTRWAFSPVWIFGEQK